MLRGITIRQLQEWRVYSDLEPWDEERADLRAASIAQAFLNVFRKKGQPPIPIERCLLRFGERIPESVSPEVARAKVRKTMDVLMQMFNPPPAKKRGKR